MNELITKSVKATNYLRDYKILTIQQGLEFAYF